MRVKIIILLFVFISVYQWLNSTTWHIKQDSTGNFTTIQEGIIAATDNDTVLVYPGTYYENIDYLEKSLTVASLYIISPEDSLINQTIIDGNHQARCVKIDECENVSLIGFTIQNGLAYGSTSSGYGGGIKVWEVSNLTISNCYLRNNKSIMGGGIFIHNSIVVLIGNRISRNWGIEKAGGILIGNNTNLQFSEIELNSVYLNYSGTGTELYISEYSGFTQNIIVDTFTVNNPDYFFIAAEFDYTFSCLNAKIEEIDQDLYVAPDGNDTNSGLTEDDPLQTIAWAQTLIKRNNENPHTIHLASGIYSPLLNNQIFPMNIKHGVHYIGVSPEETILDAEYEYPFFFQFKRDQNEFAKLVMENIKMINGVKVGSSFSGGITIYQADINLSDVVIENCSGGVGSAILGMNGYCNLSDVTIRDNTGGRGLLHAVEYNCPNPILEATFTNTKFQNNQPGDDDYSGGAMRLGGHSNIQGNYNAQLINCEISENYNNFYNPQTDMGGTSGLYVKDMVLVDAINCTFGDNTLSHSTGCVITVNKSELNFYNSILYNNDGYSFNLWENAVVNISNSLIEGGNDNVNYYYPLATVNWLEGNIDENPMFDSLGTYPFALLENSPCIDAGTLNLPAGIVLPEFDLAGNPRIVNGMIDMGAYEYQDSVSVQEDIVSSISQTKLSNYPNPFNPETTISFDLPQDSKVNISIYNIKGQKIKTLLAGNFEKGTQSVIWNGMDSNNKPIASGIYFYKLSAGKETAMKKMLLLK